MGNTDLLTGTIVKLTAGYGFIRSDDGQEDVFFFPGSLADGTAYGRLHEQQRVTFRRYRHEKGLRASDVAPAD